MSRSALSRLVTLVILALLAWGLFHVAREADRSVATPQVGGPLFPGFEPRAMDFLGMTFRDGHPLELERDEEGFWVITYPTEEQAQQEYVEVVLDNLANAQVLPIEEQAGDVQASDVGLDPPLFDMTFGHGEHRVTLFIGEFTPLHEGVYARVAGTDEIVQVTANLRTMVEQFRNQDYVDKHLLRGVRGPVSHVRIVKPEGLVLHAERTGSTWTIRAPVQGLADASRIQTLARTLGFAQQLYPAGVVDRDITQSDLTGLGFPDEAMAARGEVGGATLLELGTDGREPVRAWLQAGWEDGENEIFALRGDRQKLLVVTRNDFNLVRNGTDFFRDRSLLPPVREHASRVAVQRGDEALLDIRRGRDGRWTFAAPERLADVAVDDQRMFGRSRLSEFLGRLDGLEASGFTDEPAYGEPDATLLVVWNRSGTERSDRIELHDLDALVTEQVAARSTLRLGEGFLLDVEDVLPFLDPRLPDRLRDLAPVAVDEQRWGGVSIDVPGAEAPLTIAREAPGTTWQGDDRWARRYELAWEVLENLRGTNWFPARDDVEWPYRLAYEAFDGTTLGALELRRPGAGDALEVFGLPVVYARWSGVPDMEFSVDPGWMEAFDKLLAPEERG